MLRSLGGMGAAGHSVAGSACLPSRAERSWHCKTVSMSRSRVLLKGSNENPTRGRRCWSRAAQRLEKCASARAGRVTVTSAKCPTDATELNPWRCAAWYSARRRPPVCVEEGSTLG
jgi:hypothetical protein